MIFGSLNYNLIAIDKEQFSTKFGALIAGQDFLISLLMYGNFDEYHFFTYSKKKGEDVKENLFSITKNAEKLFFKDMCELQGSLKKNDYELFHIMDTELHRLSYLRRKTSKLFPITAMTHSLTELDQMFTGFFNMTNNIYPFDSITCTSKCGMEFLKKQFALLSERFLKEYNSKIKYNGRLDLIPLGVNLDLFKISEKNEAREKLNIAKDKIILFSMARFSISYKMDLIPLIRCFKDLLEEYKNLLLILAGDDTDYDYSTLLNDFIDKIGIKENVILMVNINEATKQLLYSAADIFVSPSDNIQETFGIAPIEAMAAGLPIVVSDWDGYKETVIHEKTGFRVPTYWENCDNNISPLAPLFTNRYYHFCLAQSVFIDVNKMKEYLKLLVEDESLRKKIGKNGIEHAKNNYDWKVIIPKYERLWAELKEISKNYKLEERQNLFEPSFYQLFNHYPTNSNFIKDSLKFKPTSLGEKINLDIFFENYIYDSIEQLIPRDNLKLILSLLKEGKNINEILQILNIGKKELNYMMMWLLKHGLITYG